MLLYKLNFYFGMRPVHVSIEAKTKQHLEGLPIIAFLSYLLGVPLTFFNKLQ
jgi:hypothetical protein